MPDKSKCFPMTPVNPHTRITKWSKKKYLYFLSIKSAKVTKGISFLIPSIKNKNEKESYHILSIIYSTVFF